MALSALGIRPIVGLLGTEPEALSPFQGTLGCYGVHIAEQRKGVMKCEVTDRGVQSQVRRGGAGDRDRR